MALNDCPIILLAAGASRRMRGRDKLLEEVDGLPLLRRQALRALEATRGAVFVALPQAPHPRYAALEGLGLRLVPVADAAEGINASLRTAFAALPKDAPCAMLLLADLPDLTRDDLKKVMGAVDLGTDTRIWRGVTEEGAPGHPIVFRADLFPAFAELKGDGGGREIIAQAEGRIETVPLPGTHARNDLDTPEDWASWRKENRTKNAP